MLSGETLVILRVLGDERTLLQYIGVLRKALLVSEVFHLAHEFVLRNAVQRVLDLCIEVRRQVDTVDGSGMMDAFLCVANDFMLWSCVLLVDS